jgi:hypothetical protein
LNIPKIVQSQIPLAWQQEEHLGGVKLGLVQGLPSLLHLFSSCRNFISMVQPNIKMQGVHQLDFSDLKLSLKPKSYIKIP